MPDATFPENVIYITQQFYSSIGYAVGSCLGAALALREKQNGSKVDYMQDAGTNNHGQGRVILLVGDGSLQMTVQEIGTMVTMGLTPIIIVINNDGHSIERAIWGPQRVCHLGTRLTISNITTFADHGIISSSFHSLAPVFHQEHSPQGQEMNWIYYSMIRFSIKQMLSRWRRFLWINTITHGV